MYPLESFLSNELFFFPHINVYDYEPEYVIDDSKYHVIDNEESDHGIKKYYFDGELVAVWTNVGGDSDWYEFTESGIELFTKIARNIFEEQLLIAKANKIK